MSKIIIYTREKCPFSNKLKKLLEEKEIEYEEKDVSKNPSFEERLVKVEGYAPIPQVECSGTMIFDYESEEKLVERIERMLKDECK